ncbi:MAG: prepilin-type N-terminal cleavage/methylation domain-containing protein [Acidobacteriota bacterium]|jgi:prepilin-type N-terminal cleavage/methylation domain-containing protein
MKNEQGFSLVELLIVVAIIAIIAAIAVPSLLTSRMAANEAGGIQGCRTAGSAEVAFASTNNANYAADLQALVDGKFLDSRFVSANGFNGYKYDSNVGGTNLPAPTAAPSGFSHNAIPQPGYARYKYAIGADQVVRYEAFIDPATVDPGNPKMAPGDGIGIQK